jgi:parallel beta-helix repeat protein
MYEKIQKRYTVPMFGLAVVLLLAAAPAQALTPVNPANGCAQTLNTPGEYVLTGDLNCSGTKGIGLNIAASTVVFHLAGHTISSTDCDLTKNISGIFVQSGISGVQIDGGKVSGFNDGIGLSSSSSRVTGMTVTGACAFGMAVTGQNNQVDMSVVTASGIDGIGLGSASNNLIVSNDISGNVRLGVDISNFSNNNVVERNIINNNGIIAGQQGGVAIFNGTNNVIRDNTLNNNFDGILIESPRNTAHNNRVNGSSGNGSNGVGIAITSDGAPSVVTRNTVLGSSLADMSDGSASCDGNTWRNNVYQTAAVVGGNTTCIQ